MDISRYSTAVNSDDAFQGRQPTALGSITAVNPEDWVLEGSLAEFLEVFEVWPAPEAKESFQKCGVRYPPHF